MPRVGLIGPGRAGQALVRLLPPAQYEIGPVLSSSFTSTRRAVRRMRLGTAAASYDEFASCELILIAVPDDAIAVVARDLAAVSFPFRGKVVLHTSGALDSSVLAPLRARGASTGSLHPLQTFGRGLLSLAGVTFAVEGDQRALRLARSLINAWHGKLLRLKASQKTLYHAAATFASPLFTPLMEAAVRLMGHAGVGPKTAVRALRPLLATTLENYMHSRKQSWTGPLARGDAETVRRHLEAVGRVDPNLARYYRAAARAALILFRRHPKLQRLLQKARIP
ncbi:MAG: DUF2520 domain-containing protein [Acidobacteria bacterium]|nr:DUF2520 domain-containing protein [Acidobacteriota bacterium]